VLALSVIVALPAADAAGQEAAAQALVAEGDQLRAARRRVPIEESLRVYARASAAAAETGDTASEARALLGQGASLVWLARYRESLEPLQRARELFRARAERSGEAEALTLFAEATSRRTGPVEAIPLQREALSLAREARDRRVEALVLNHLAWMGPVQGALTMEEKREAANSALTIRRELELQGDIALSLCAQAYLTEDRETSVRILEEALAVAERANDPMATGFALSLLGWRHSDGLDTSRALSLYQRALPLHREAGHFLQEPYTLEGLARLQSARGRVREALKAFEETLAVHRRLENRHAVGYSLHNIGVMLDDLGDHAGAMKHFEEALATHRLNKDRTEEGTTFIGIASLKLGQGSAAEALQLAESALAAYDEVRDEPRKAFAYAYLGMALGALGRFSESIVAYQTALDLALKFKNTSFTVSMQRTLGASYSLIGDYQKAREHLESASTTARAGKLHMESAVLLSHLANLEVALGQPAAAQTLLDEAMPLLDEFDRALAKARVLTAQGRVSLVAGRHDDAIEYFQRALTEVRKEAAVVNEPSLFVEIGKAYRLAGNRQAAAEWFQRALVTGRAVGAGATDALVLVELMHFWNRPGERGVAAFYGKQAVNLFQQVRADLRQLDLALQRAYVAARADTYRDLADLLIADGRLPEAQQVLNLLKDQEFFDFIRRDGTQDQQTQAILTPQEATWQTRYAATSDRIAAIGRERGELLAIRGRTPEEERRLETLEQDLVAAGEAFGRFLDAVAADLGRGADARARVYALQEAQGLMEDLRELGPGTVALYTLVSRERYRVVLITPDARLAGESAISAEALNRKVLAFRQALEDPRTDPRPLAEELYRLLVQPVAGALDQAGAHTLMWALDGTLRYLPIAALHDGRQYLAERYRHVLFTPASHSRLKDPPSPDWRGLGAGVSKPSAEFSALPAVVDELRGIFGADGQTAGVVPGQVLLDEAFTAAAFRARLRERLPVVHVATHFQFRPGNERDSFLLLGDGSRLTLADLRSAPNLFGGVELLTLSACNTAVGDAGATGAEVEGASVLAQRNGAKAVIASLWPVADTSTRLFMEAFYRARQQQRMTKADALRHAQLTLLTGAAGSSNRTFAHPYYWAPFTLIGNWK
jgi:CHAT domain-containing protein